MADAALPGVSSIAVPGCLSSGPGIRLPECLVPKGGAPGPAGTAAWIASNKAELLKVAARSGAVLLRGFGIESADDFADAVDALGLEHMPYVGGAAVRTLVAGGRAATANESPAASPIPPHHELAQTPSPPSHICFFCEVAPATGGETPLLDSRVVAEHAAGAHPALFERLERDGVRYLRVLPEESDATSSLGRSWKESFGASCREEAEAAMAAQGTTVAWLADGSAQTLTRVLPAVTREAGSGRPVFFNQVLAAATGWSDARNVAAEAVRQADGSVADAAALAELAAWAEAKATAAVPWEVGDVLIVDNRVAMHSRRPFTGPRRVLAAIRREGGSGAAKE